MQIHICLMCKTDSTYVRSLVIVEYAYHGHYLINIQYNSLSYVCVLLTWTIMMNKQGSSAMIFYFLVHLELLASTYLRIMSFVVNSLAQM